MSVEPKNIWKRPIKGWRLFAARLVVLTSLIVVLAFLVLFCLVPSSPEDRVLWSFFIGFALLLVLGYLFFRWLCYWRNLRRLLLVLACLATLVALFYAEENIRGKHAWEMYRRELEARGEQLDWKAFIPKPVPDEQNFAATPLIQSWFERIKPHYESWSDRKNKPRGDSFSLVENNISTPPAKGDEGNRHFTDLVAWEMAFAALQSGPVTPLRKFSSDKLDLASRAQAAPSVLEALKTNDIVFAELRAASHRPYSRYPVNYNLDDPWRIVLPHLNRLRGKECKRLQLKACAELVTGQSENALENVNLILYMADSVKEEPFLISYLVRIACLQLAVQPIWEGLAEHAWSDAQLQELQTRLHQYNFVADLKRALDSERAAGILTFDLLLRKKYSLGQLTNMNNPNSARTDVTDIFPRGWYYLEEVNYCRLFQIQLGGTFDPVERRVSPSRAKANAQAFDRTFRRGAGRLINHQIIAAMLTSALNRLPLKAAVAQTATDEAALGCALERYRLANGQFPEELDALVPRFCSQLPHDVITGEPYKYRRTEAGQFVLYSVGWKEKDDSGVPGKTLFDEKEGDWVWQYPSSE